MHTKAFAADGVPETGNTLRELYCAVAVHKKMENSWMHTKAFAAFEETV